jgi:hypothetical protein
MAMVKMRRVEGIIISVTGYTWRPGLQTIKKELSELNYAKFLLYMAEMCQRELISAIDKQRYKKDVKIWPPLNMKYLKYKKKHNLSTNIWEATSTLKNGISIFKRGDYIVVGFKKTATYPNTTLKINKVAGYVEYGGVKLRPRPLFRKIPEYLRKNVDRSYKKFKRDILKIK